MALVLVQRRKKSSVSQRTLLTFPFYIFYSQDCWLNGPLLAADWKQLVLHLAVYEY